MRKFLSVVAAGSLLAGCADAGNTADKPFDGPGINLDIAALNLAGVGDVVWDLQVENGNSPTPDVVWQQRITSSQYGDSAGSASYVGPCDADTSAAGINSNTVSVWVVGVYDGDVTSTEAGGFNTAVALTGGQAAVPFQNPTWYDAPGSTIGVRDEANGDTDTPLTRVFTCVENQDVFVQFDVALMRPAQQGFFDIAVNFNSIFCSAKFDCSYADSCGGTFVAGTTAGTCDHSGAACSGATQAEADLICGNYDINLLHNSDSQRSSTYILGFACTAGAGADGDVLTRLFLDNLTISCGANPGDSLLLDTSALVAGDGNQCTSGNGTTPMTCAGGILYSDTTTAGTFDADIGATGTTRLFQYAIYQGTEDLVDGVTGLDAQKKYWNLAIGAASLTGCTISTAGTADDELNTSDNVGTGSTGGANTIAAGTVYPYVTWDVDVNTCTQHPLTFGDPTAFVGTSYTTTTGSALVFNNSY